MDWRDVAVARRVDTGPAGVRHVDVAGCDAVYGLNPQPLRNQHRPLLRHHTSAPVRHQAHPAAHDYDDRRRLGAVSPHQRPGTGRLESQSHRRTVLPQPGSWLPYTMESFDRYLMK